MALFESYERRIDKINGVLADSTASAPWRSAADLQRQGLRPL